MLSRSTCSSSHVTFAAEVEPPAKRVKKMGCGASTPATAAPIVPQCDVVAVQPKKMVKRDSMSRADSAFDFSTYKGDFEPTALENTTKGEKYTLDYRMHFTHKGSALSPWHDISYKASKDTYHMMCEIPKWTRAKFEVATKEENNPMKQDEKKGTVREYKHGDMLFNYGFMPQTWEDPNIVTKDTGFKGDDDPLDMVEVGCRRMGSGEVAEVKVLGVLAMIDDGETDWKVFCIRTDDPLADKISDVEDLERELPGAVSAMREWFRVYKVAEGKPLNKFGLDEKCMPRAYAEMVVEETHEFWVNAEQKLRAAAGPAARPSQTA